MRKSRDSVTYIKKGKKISFNRKVLRREYTYKKQTIKQVAEKLKCTPYYVSKALRFFRISIRPPNCASKPLDLNGERVGSLVLGPIKKRVKGVIYRECVCDCGDVLLLPSGHVSDIRKRGGRRCYKCERIHNIPNSLWTRIELAAISRNLPYEVDREYLYNLHKKQKGKCVFTGWDIPFPKYIKDFAKGRMVVSLDRINSKKGYIKGNLQWVHKDINMLKMHRLDEDFIRICKAVSDWNS